MRIFTCLEHLEGIGQIRNMTLKVIGGFLSLFQGLYGVELHVIFYSYRSTMLLTLG